LFGGGGKCGRRYSERLLVALVCAQVVAGAEQRGQPAPGSPNAASPAATTSSGDKCGLPPRSTSAACRTLPTASMLSKPGYNPACGFADGPETAHRIGGLKRSTFTVRSGANPEPIVLFSRRIHPRDPGLAGYCRRCFCKHVPEDCPRRRPRIFRRREAP